jgi:hypothetical protein
VQRPRTLSLRARHDEVRRADHHRGHAHGCKAEKHEQRDDQGGAVITSKEGPRVDSW